MLADYKFAKARIHVAASSDITAVAGRHVVVVRAPSRFNCDLPVDWRAKDPHITAMEFHTGEGNDCGRFLWCESKNGHAWEFDVQQRSHAYASSGAHHVTQLVHDNH